MRRWTRMPDSEKLRHPDGTLLHHMPATIPRLARDFADPGFAERQGYFRLYFGTIVELIDRISESDREDLGLPEVVPPTSDARYAVAEDLEGVLIRRVRSLYLHPWNGTRGATAGLSSDALAKGLTLRSSRQP